MSERRGKPKGRKACSLNSLSVSGRKATVKVVSATAETQGNQMNKSVFGERKLFPSVGSIVL